MNPFAHATAMLASALFALSVQSVADRYFWPWWVAFSVTLGGIVAIAVLIFLLAT